MNPYNTSYNYGTVPASSQPASQHTPYNFSTGYDMSSSEAAAPSRPNIHNYQYLHSSQQDQFSFTGHPGTSSALQNALPTGSLHHQPTGTAPYGTYHGRIHPRSPEEEYHERSKRSRHQTYTLLHSPVSPIHSRLSTPAVGPSHYEDQFLTGPTQPSTTPPPPSNFGMSAGPHRSTTPGPLFDNGDDREPEPSTPSPLIGSPVPAPQTTNRARNPGPSGANPIPDSVTKRFDIFIQLFALESASEAVYNTYFQVY